MTLRNTTSRLQAKRRAAKAALGERRERRRRLFECAGDAVTLPVIPDADRPGRFLEANEAAYLLFGCTRDELEQRVLLQERMASLGRVAAGIVHDVRNPLSGINVFLDVIRENFEDPDNAEDVRRMIDEARNASDKIESVLRRVLDFARPGRPSPRPVDLNRAVEEALKLQSSQLRKAGIRIEAVLAEDLPVVTADLELIELVVLNLVTNAAEALENVEGPRRIRVETRRTEEGALIRVEDSGPGVPEPPREKIFEPFHTTRPHGAGIGLSLCRRILKDHRGGIEVSPSPLGGCAFTVRIPTTRSSER